MRRASLYRMSGNSLMLSGLLFALAVILLPRARTTSIAEVLPMVGAAWVAAGVLAILGAVLSMAAMIGVYRHFMDTEQEPWALLALGASICGTALGVLSGGLVALGQPLMLAAAGAATSPAAYDPGQAAFATVFATTFVISGTVMWLSLIALGVAMLHDPVWPRWIVRGAALVGAVEVLAPFALMGQPMVSRLVTVLGFAYLVFLGNAITRIPRTGAVKAATPPAAVEV